MPSLCLDNNSVFQILFAHLMTCFGEKIHSRDYDSGHHSLN